MITLAQRSPGIRSAAPFTFQACSICLRVLDGTTWVEAEHIIRTLRTYDLPHAVQLDAGLCDVCADELDRRRAVSRAESV